MLRMACGQDGRFRSICLQAWCTSMPPGHCLAGWGCSHVRPQVTGQGRVGDSGGSGCGAAGARMGAAAVAIVMNDDVIEHSTRVSGIMNMQLTK
jgi:hypothetical protein